MHESGDTSEQMIISMTCIVLLRRLHLESDGKEGICLLRVPYSALTLLWRATYRSVEKPTPPVRVTRTEQGKLGKSAERGASGGPEMETGFEKMDTEGGTKTRQERGKEGEMRGDDPLSNGDQEGIEPPNTTGRRALFPKPSTVEGLLLLLSSKANMDNASLSTLIEIAYAQQHAIFTFVATLAILVAEVAHSFPDEVSLPPSNPLHHECCNDSDQSLTLRTVKVALIWQSEWNMGKVLFLVTRLLPFWDGIVVYLYNQTSTPTSIRVRQAAAPIVRVGPKLTPIIKQCEKVFVVVAYLTLLGGIFAEVILYLRVFALSGSSRWVGWLLSILFLSLHGTAFAFVAKFLGSLKYVPSPVPTVIACLPVAGNHMHLSIVNILIASSELAILALTLWFLLSKFRGTRSRLIVLFYRDGVLYFLAITGVTMGNVVCNVVASWQESYAYILGYPQIALHSIIATRMVLHMRKAHQTSFEASDDVPLADIPMSDIRFQVRVNVQREETVDCPARATTAQLETWPNRDVAKASPVPF
ncbi:hypothetical protein NMY22_g15502 [Coprinellus aureogranulatus]|nr:hypothetical protein NMY22_g15502 [Coprinellus aureogranulatus]